MTALFELAARLQSANAAEGMLWMVVKATLILAIARLVLLALPRASAAVKHLIATAALVGVAAMPIFSVVIPAWELQVARAELREPSRAEALATRNPQLATPTIGVTDQESEPSPIATAISVARATGLADKPLSLLERSSSLIRSTWKGLVVIAIAVVALLMLGQMVVGMAGVWFVSRKAEELTSDLALRELDDARDHLALNREVRLLRTSRVAVPVVWGMFRPVLLLPADVNAWPADRLRVVLLHELAHLKRWDGVSLILTRIALSLFWFHPLAWTLERAGRSECERACDDLVLASGTKPSEYADHLLAIARTMPAFDPFRSVTLAMSRKSQLEGRLLSILQRDVARRVFSGRGVAVACALALAVIIPVSAVRLIARPSGEIAKKPVIQEEKLKSDSEVTVTPDVEAIGDYLLAKMGGEPRHAEGWYDRAYDLYRDDRYAEAAVAFRRAGDEGFRRATSYYNAACSYALIGDATSSLADLDRAIREGWDDFEKIADDSDFDPIRRDPRFRAMLEARLHDAASRRVTKTMERYEALKEGRVIKEKDEDDIGDAIAAAIQGGIHGGIHDGIHDGIKDGVRDGVKDGVRGALHDGDHWFDVGMDLLRLRHNDQAIHAFEQAIARNEKVSASTYNIACAYSLKQDARNGMAWLDKAIENGFSSEEKFGNDPDIAFLRGQPGFKALQQKAEDLEMKGCCDGPVKFLLDNWKDSVAHHRAMVQKHPNSGRAWFNLGFVALQAREFPTALDAFRRTNELNYRPGTASYNIACAHALQGNRDQAFEWLKRAGNAGFDVADYAIDDDDLDKLHGDPRWDALVESARGKKWARKRK
jgi:beta-lactamase regulating signal transducer with metallopeptidase domain